MKQPAFAILAAIGAMVVVWLVAFSAMLTYSAIAGDDMMDGMWDMMDDMGGMQGMMGGGGGPQTTGSARGSGEVRIADFRFEPSIMNVSPGTVITWTNEDQAPHTATSRDESFDTGRLDEGESAEAKFETPGTFEYFCEVHSSMTGRIVVAND